MASLPFSHGGWDVWSPIVWVPNGRMGLAPKCQLTGTTTVRMQLSMCAAMPRSGGGGSLGWGSVPSGTPPRRPALDLISIIPHGGRPVKGIGTGSCNYSLYL
jgi:hypothetical protein